MLIEIDMESPIQLWFQYHNAVKSGNSDVAQATLKKIHSLKSLGNRATGCSSCNRRLG